MGLAAFNRMRRIREEAEKAESVKSEPSIVTEPIPVEEVEKENPASEEFEKPAEGTKTPSAKTKRK